jgi:uncharacterized damage-inducible protein DinB
MQLFAAVKKSIQQLTDALDQLTAEQYSAASANLSGSSIGQHTRHIIELYQCLLTGYEQQYVCYDDRKRDVRIETDLAFAKQSLLNIATSVEREDIQLQLAGVYDEEAQEQLQLSTNYYRELLYNYEHTIHHMALIRVGLKEAGATSIAENFGIASSTIRHREQCAQ